MGGVAVSTNDGKDWALLTSAHLHADIHGLVLTKPTPRGVDSICSDGGLAATPDLGTTFSTGGNRQLPNFQFSRFTASFQNSGLVGGSLQDNGNVYTMQYVNVDPWRDLDGGDGVLMSFPQSGHLVRSNNTLVLNVGGKDVKYGNKPRIASWNDSKRTFQDLKLLPNDPLSRGVIPVDATGDGLSFHVVEVVDVPSWTNAGGHPMLAVAVQTETVYGLFEDGTGRFAWNQLMLVPHQPNKDAAGNELPYFATAVGSFDGNAIFVGMINGKVFRLDAPFGPATDVTIPGNTNPVIRFVPVGSAPIFAIAGAKIFRQSGTAWTDVTPTAPAPTSSLTALTSDRGNPRRELF